MCQGDGGQYMGRNGHQWRPSRIREISDGRWPGLSYWWWKVEWIYVCGCTPRIHGIGFYLPTCTIKINYIDVCKYTWIPWIMLCFFLYCVLTWEFDLVFFWINDLLYMFFLAMRFGLVSCDFCQPRVMLCLYMYVLTEGFDLVVFFCHTEDVNDLMIQPASPQSMNRFSSSTGWNSWSAERLPQKGSKLMLVKGCWVVHSKT